MASGLSLVVVMLVAVIAVGVAIAGEPAGRAGPAPLVRAGEGGSCPLSLGQQTKSVKAFARMLPVFRHPRCSNCHGGVNPFEAEVTSKHGGGRMDPSVSAEQCQACHDQLPGWDVPGPPMFFAGRSDEEICMQMKTFGGTGADFIEHIRNDNGGTQFIAAGFRGERALGKESQDTSDSGEPFAAAPPPGTREELTQKARDWVKAMGGEFAGSPECGCRRGKIELRMTSDWAGSAMGNSVTAQASATVPLIPDSSGLRFTGVAPLVHGRYGVTIPPGCTVDMKPVGGELQVNEARFSDEKEMAISLDLRPTASGGTMTFHCPKLPDLPVPIMPWAGQWSYLHQPDVVGDHFHFDRFDLAPATDFGGGRALIARKEVRRTTKFQEMTLTSTTTFEFWWLGLESGQ